MKFSAGFLALLALSPATAFTTQTSKSTGTSLYSSFASVGTGVGIGARVAGDELASRGPYSDQRDDIWDTSSPIIVQGGSLKTWSFLSPAVERVQVVLKTEGRPLDADIELWQGPDNTPHKMRVYVEDGSLRPFRAVVETPRGPNTIAIRNIGHLEFPLTACVAASMDRTGPSAVTMPFESSKVIQGGALRTYPFDPVVMSVGVLLRTDGRPLNARIELLQGPNNNKQVLEIYTEDGMDRPFFVVIDTPGSGNVVRVVNTATVEFPMTASVEAFEVGGPAEAGFEPVLGGDGEGPFGSRVGQW
jgi:hypothetical protein